MERLDPLLLGDIPEDLPMDLFDEDFMDSYCNELACTATEAPNGIHAGIVHFLVIRPALCPYIALKTEAKRIFVPQVVL